MTEWQYNNKIPIDRGYFTNMPSNAAANNSRHTGFLEDQDGQRLYLYITDIESGFSQGGSYAQSVFKRDWHGRNFVQPRFIVRGQTPNQKESGRLAEFIRKTQDKSLRWQGADKLSNTAKLVVRSNPGPPNKKRQGYVMFGHILRSERKAERWVNAPDYQFEFLLSFSYVGLFRQGQQDQINKFTSWSDFLKRSDVAFTRDPDAYTIERPPIGDDPDSRPT